jgi:hypothetical protein
MGIVESGDDFWVHDYKAFGYQIWDKRANEVSIVVNLKRSLAFGAQAKLGEFNN